MVDNSTWFYIQSTRTKHVISACRRIPLEGLVPSRTQVHVYPSLQKDEELWRWDGQFIRNKATSLVLDIRKGRLRLIEDTEICLYPQKPLDEASNQLWGMRDTQQGQQIYSVSNADWTLMQDGDKLLLYPQEPLFHHDTWDCIGEQQFLVALATTTVASDPADAGTSSIDTDYNTPQGGLSPAKRESQGSVNLYSMDSFKNYHDRLYVEKDAHLSDKAISMAVAYHSWLSLPKKDNRIQFQHQAEQQALDLLIVHQDHHKETVLHLTNRYINLLYDQKVATS